jgi:hypothetical protein
MDLSGHDLFSRGQSAATERQRQGEAMLEAAWAALASRRADAIDLHLRSGSVIAGVLAVRVDGDIGHASTRLGQWTHFFPSADIAFIAVAPRGASSATT